eukprot:1953256-Rhodomonas_salina.2
MRIRLFECWTPRPRRTLCHVSVPLFGAPCVVCQYRTVRRETLCQYRTSRSTICCVSTAHGVGT